MNSKAQGFVDWSWTAREIIVFCNAFGSGETAPKTGIRNSIFEIESASLRRKKYFHPFTWGLVIRQIGETLTVAANGGELAVVLRDAPESGRRNLEGERLHTSIHLLEQAKQLRPKLLPSGEWENDE